MLEDQRDLEVMEAEYKVYAEKESKLRPAIMDEEETHISLTSQLSKQHHSIPYVQDSQDGFTPVCPEGKPELRPDEMSLAQVLKDSLAVTRLPVPEPFTFTGDPLTFTEWRTCFKALIETSCTNSAHRLFYLKKYLSGEALGVLEGTFYRSDDEAYTQALDALNQCYGHPFIVQRAFRLKLSNWPKIGPRESLKLREMKSCTHYQLQLFEDVLKHTLVKTLLTKASTGWNLIFVAQKTIILCCILILFCGLYCLTMGLSCQSTMDKAMQRRITSQGGYLSTPAILLQPTSSPHMLNYTSWPEYRKPRAMKGWIVP